ncbi:MAG: carboxypeptidase regulatory-like domain-containing protein [Myxococcales bacterium]|jgi:protocatechuate 3,4-dioxygenase beta subunit|nr:carboxypeptidase regulatory-like domain-containing protein [Myxococcales bacterium]
MEMVRTETSSPPDEKPPVGPARAVGAWLRLALLALTVVAALGLVPGAPRRAPLLEPTSAPAVPDSVKDRDAELEVAVRGADRVSVRVYTMLEGRAYIAAEGITSAGAVALSGLPRGEHWVVADAPGMSRASAMVVTEPGRRRVELAMEPERTVDVSVKDEAGAPKEAAEVEVLGAEPVPIGALTDASGRVKVGRLRAGPWVVRVRAPGYEPVVRRGAREGELVEVVLRKLGAFVVTVVDSAGAPAGRARVLITSASLHPARIADADERGVVRIGSLDAGAYALRAVRGSAVSPVELAASLGVGEEKAVTLKLASGVHVAVRVVDDEGERADPVAGAQVTVAEGGVSPFPVEGVTDGQGRAVLGPVLPGGVTVSVSATGFAPRGPMRAPEGEELRVVLSRSGAIEGRVVDDRGFAIDGATLRVVGTDFYGGPVDEDPDRQGFRDALFAARLSGPTPLVKVGELGVVPGPVPPIPPPGAAIVPTGPPLAARPKEVEPWTTRRDGTFRVSPVPAGRVRLLVRHPQYVEAESELVTLKPGEDGKVQVVMQRGGSIEGRVVDASGRGVDGAHVLLVPARAGVEKSSRTASDGTFAFASVPDAVTLLVSYRDDPSDYGARVDVAVREGKTERVSVTLPERRPPLEVTVKDGRGRPVENAQVTAHSSDASAALRTTAFTDARGRVELAGARGIAVRLEVRGPDFAPLAKDVDASAARAEVTLALAETLAGEVRERRAPLADADVTVFADTGSIHVRTGPDGAFRVRDLAPGPVKLRVRKPGFGAVVVDANVAASDGRRPTELRPVELGEEAVVEGSVVDDKGKPVAFARVAEDGVPVFLATGQLPPGAAMCDKSGRFVLRELRAGTVALEAYSPEEGRGRAADVRLVAGRTTTNVKIALTRGDGPAKDDRSPGGVAVTLGETADPREVVVAQVAEGSEAERAGLRPGDVVLEVDGAPVKTMEAARARLSGPLALDVLVKVRRGERVETRRVTRERVRR